MKNHSCKDWIMATRPWAFPASAMPVAVTLAYLCWMGEDVNWTNGIWAIFNIVLFHAAGNTWSDYFDFKNKVDTEDAYCVKTLTGGLFSPRELMNLSLTLIAIAIAGGLGLLWRTGWPLLAIGVGGLVCTILYPASKYRALGDLVIFVSYALLPMLGTAYVATGHINWSTMWISLPVGLITVAILHANNTRDMSTDRRAGIRTLALKLGRRTSAGIYCAEVLAPFGWIVGCVALGVFPVWTLLSLLALKPALANVRIMNRFSNTETVNITKVDEMTAQLQLSFSLLLILSFAVACFI